MSPFASCPEFPKKQRKASFKKNVHKTQINSISPTLVENFGGLKFFFSNTNNHPKDTRRRWPSCATSARSISLTLIDGPGFQDSKAHPTESLSFGARFGVQIHIFWNLFYGGFMKVVFIGKWIPYRSFVAYNLKNHTTYLDEHDCVIFPARLRSWKFAQLQVGLIN